MSQQRWVIYVCALAVCACLIWFMYYTQRTNIGTMFEQQFQKHLNGTLHLKPPEGQEIRKGGMDFVHPGKVEDRLAKKLKKIDLRYQKDGENLASNLDQNEDTNSNQRTDNHRSTEGQTGRQEDQTKENLVQILTKELEIKLKQASKTSDLKNRTCATFNIKYKDKCDATENSSCPPRYLPVKLEDRIEQLVLRENLQVPSQYRDVLKDMENALPGSYDVIIVSALSSNHYKESQAMIKNLHEVVFPVLKNFTFVVYDLGLTDEQRKTYQKYCRCHLLRFPFKRFPSHFKTLRCFSWKATVIRAHYPKANILIWTDASIRIRNGSSLLEMIERTRTRGIQQRAQPSAIPVPFHTLLQMFHFFGDNPCAYMMIPQVESGFGIYHRELFVEKAFLDPFFACGLRKECICPVEQNKVQGCPKNKQDIGLCMRTDQSAVTIILGKLFREKYRYFVVNNGWFQDVVRGPGKPYFEELSNKSESMLQKD